MRLRDFPQVSIQRCDFADFSSTAGDGGADLITMVAVPHHLDLDDTLARIPRLPAPGGRLLVVGLARPDSLAIWHDAQCSVISQGRPKPAAAS
jgi:SAM-dependent methyltransferase